MPGISTRPAVRFWHAASRLAAPERDGPAARERLLSAANPPAVDLLPRADGPGSSQDLPQFAAMGQRLPRAPLALEEPGWSWSADCLRTPGACIDGEPVRFRAVPAEDPDAFEYYAPDFHTEPRSVVGPVPGKPEYFVNNILAQFDLRGIRIEADPMPAVYRGTGLGGSNLAHAGAICLASALSGLDLGLGQIYVYATQLENYFGVTGEGESLRYGVSLTGGQEALTALQGGFWDNVHLPSMLGPHGVVSRELLPPERYDEAARHLLLVNVGQRREGGVTSSTISGAWMSAWRDDEGAAIHHRKRELAYRSAEAVRTGDWAAYARCLGEYRDARARLCPAYLTGQDELAGLCREHEAQYFPLGGGLGTCLVGSSDPSAISAIRAHFARTAAPADLARGRAVLPFRVNEKGVRFHHFEDCGLHEPVMTDSPLVSALAGRST